MRIGTRSVLFGVHCFLIHPLLVALAWWKVHGLARVKIGERLVWRSTRLNSGAELRRAMLLPVRASILDARVWVAFFVHDLGYLAKPNMDGAEGETHPELGAAIMRRLFGEPWGDFVLLHSRYYAKKLGRPVSALSYPDKMVIVLEPWWLYLPRAWATGELYEYMEVGAQRADRWQPADALTQEEALAIGSRQPRRWYRGVQAYMRRWVAEHRDGREDTWTRARQAGGVA